MVQLDPHCVKGDPVQNLFILQVHFSNHLSTLTHSAPCTYFVQTNTFERVDGDASGVMTTQTLLWTGMACVPIYGK